jgi:hypothetical protein
MRNGIPHNIIKLIMQLRWALTTRGTKLTTFIGLSRATGLYGQTYLFLSKFTHAYLSRYPCG